MCVSVKISGILYNFLHITLKERVLLQFSINTYKLWISFYTHCKGGLLICYQSINSHMQIPNACLFGTLYAYIIRGSITARQKLQKCLGVSITQAGYSAERTNKKITFAPFKRTILSLNKKIAFLFSVQNVYFLPEIERSQQAGRKCVQSRPLTLELGGLLRAFDCFVCFLFF